MQACERRKSLERMDRTLVAIIALALYFTTAESATTVDQFLDKCIDSKNHKSKPGREGKDFLGHCQPWSNHSCCTTSTADKIEADGILSLYNMVLDQCPTIKNMSANCRKHFKRDTCFYECSPNLAPWIGVDSVSKKTRKERATHIPLCAKDCDTWFEDCKDDFTCSGNWGDSTTWNWKKKGSAAMCTQPCKRFKEYYPDPITFCEKLFNYSFKYGTSASECMSMWPKSWKDNQKVAKVYAEQRIRGSANTVQSNLLRVSMLILSGFIFL